MSTSPMISIDQFAADRKVATRTVRRWLDAGQLQGAVKVAGKWSIPADVERHEPLAGVVATTSTTGGHGRELANVTVPAILAPLPVMVPLDTAARVLGISEYTLRRHADYFELQRLGAHGAYVMPKARIRALEG